MTSDAPARDFDLLKSLEIFVSVADTGSMTAAAGRLRITQSAISQQIKLLERDCGAPLLYRDVRPLRLTPAGLILRNRAGALLLGAREMRSEVRQAAAGSLPHLRIAMLSTFARQLVPAILQAVAERTIAAENVTITRGLTVNHAQDLANREIDVAFTSDAFEQTPDLEQVELLRESYMLVAPQGVVDADMDLRRLAARLPFLRYSSRTQSGQRIEAHLRRLRLDFPRSTAFEASDDLIGAIVDGHGWSIVAPSQLLNSLTAKHRVDARALPKPGLDRAIGLVWRVGEMSDTMQQLTSLCLTVLQRQIAPRLREILPPGETRFDILGSTAPGER